MDKLSFFKNLCQSTFDQCFVFMKDNKNHQYTAVELKNKDDDGDSEDTADNDDWGMSGNIYNKSPINEKSNDMPVSTVKKSILIGNYDDDTLVRKRDEVASKPADTYDDVFGDVSKPTFDQKINKPVTKTVPSKKSAKKEEPQQNTEKFKMDDEMKIEDGWGDDYEIKL